MLVITLAAPLRGISPVDQTLAEQLQKGIYTEETLKNKEEAARIYRQILAAPTVPEAISTEAQRRLARLLLTAQPAHTPPTPPLLPTVLGVVEQGRYRHLASGITWKVLTTGSGTPYGLAAAPVIKVSTRTELAERWSDLIDIDAGRIASGEVTIEDVGWELFHLILDVASGRKKPWSDQWGLFNTLALFNPAPVT